MDLCLGGKISKGMLFTTVLTECLTTCALTIGRATPRPLFMEYLRIRKYISKLSSGGWLYDIPKVKRLWQNHDINVGLLST